jgi:predicted transcriptional regulator
MTMPSLGRLSPCVEDAPGNWKQIAAGISAERQDWGGDPPNLRVLARSMLADRRRFERHFDADLFADAARDILLDLFVAEEEHKQVTVSSCCIAATVPATTALRYINQLKARGLVVTVPSLNDGRMTTVRLTEKAREQMVGYLLAVANARR